MQDVVIVAATRTAVGSFQGSLAHVPAVELGAAVIRQLLAQTGLDGAQVDEVIMGQVLTAGAGQNPARQAAIKAGLPFAVPALTLNKVCGSGLKALHLGAQAIRCGDAEVIIAGGQENMSLSNYIMPGARTGLRMGHSQIVDTMMACGMRSTITTWASPPRTLWINTTSAEKRRTPLPQPHSRKLRRPLQPGVLSMKSRPS